MIVGAICARGGSKGVPRKNLKSVGGMSLVERAIGSALSCPLIDRVVVSTDDDEIAAVAKRAGAVVPFRRPAELAQDSSPKWPVFQHLVGSLEKDGDAVSVLVDLDAACPLRSADDISACIRLLLESDAEVVITAYEPERNPYFNMVELSPDGLATIVKPMTEAVTSRQEAPKVFSLSPSVFAIRRAALHRYSHWSQSRVRIHEIPRERAIDIDSELDLQIATFLLQRSEGGAA